jgi:DNA-binding protein YbaB
LDWKPTPTYEEAWSDYERLRESLATLRQNVQEVTETAYSLDGLVRATVDAQGQLTELALDPRIYRTTDSAALAETITATIREAVAAAAGRMIELTKPFLPDGVDVTHPTLGRLDPRLDLGKALTIGGGSLKWRTLDE